MAAREASAIRASISKWATKISSSAPIATANSSCALARNAIEQRARQERRPPLPRRRLGLPLPRLSRPAATLAKIGWTADRRRLRLLQHALETAAGFARRRQADASRGDF